MNDIGRIWIDDSMQGMYKAGDFVDIDTSVKSFQYDAVYAFQVDENKFIARLQSTPNEDLIVLLANYGSKDWTITENMNFEIVGRVVKGWVGKNV